MASTGRRQEGSMHVVNKAVLCCCCTFIISNPLISENLLDPVPRPFPTAWLINYCRPHETDGFAIASKATRAVHNSGSIDEGAVIASALTASATRVKQQLVEDSPRSVFLPRLATEAEASFKRLSRIRRRNIRFLCGARGNRARGVLRPALAAAAEAAAARKSSPEDDYVRESLQLKDPLVIEQPAKRWRIQWFPSFARKSLIPLVRAYSRCDVLVEVRDARLPLLSRCNLRMLKGPLPKAVILTHADQASLYVAQRFFHKGGKSLAKSAFIVELQRAVRFSHPQRSGSACDLCWRRIPGLLEAMSRACPLAPRVPYLFVDAREQAAAGQVQRLLRSLVSRHRRYQRDLQQFRISCKRLAARVAQARTTQPVESAPVGSVASAITKAAAHEAKHVTWEEASLSRALVRKRKPVRVLLVGAPNVGKSKLANCLLGRTAARSYRWPGVTRSVNIYRHPLSPARQEDASRLFDVVDSPGFLPLHASGRKKKYSCAQFQQQLQQRLGTAARLRQLPLELFFDFEHPRSSADELALLAAFQLLPESALFTIEEAAVALGNKLFSMRKQRPAATDFDRVMSRYKLDPLAFDQNSSTAGVQLLLTELGCFLNEAKITQSASCRACVCSQLAEQRHHGNTGAAAQRLLSDLTQGYLGRHTFELPPPRSLHLNPSELKGENTVLSNVSTSFENTGAQRLQQLLECLQWRAHGGIGEVQCDRSSIKILGKADLTTQSHGKKGNTREWNWIMRRHGQRLSFLLASAGSPPHEAYLIVNKAVRKKKATFPGPQHSAFDLNSRELPQGGQKLCTRAAKRRRHSGPSDDAEKTPLQNLSEGWLEGW
ncbi:hypothetical protein ACSSS7_001044 [Eimeria intestinalis]